MCKPPDQSENPIPTRAGQTDTDHSGRAAPPPSVRPTPIRGAMMMFCSALMAVVKVNSVKTGLAKTVRYVINPDKTRDGQLTGSNYERCLKES